MYADWTKAAQEAIAAIAHSLGPNPTLAERKKALRDRAGSFHRHTSWGRKVWGRECRKHLEMHGQPKRLKPQEPSLPWPDHISFPFRGVAIAEAGARTLDLAGDSDANV